MELHPWWYKRDRWFQKDYRPLTKKKIVLFFCKEQPKKQSKAMDSVKRACQESGHEIFVTEVSEFRYEYMESPHCAIKWNSGTKKASIMDLSGRGTALSKFPVPDISTSKMEPTNPFVRLAPLIWHDIKQDRKSVV